MQEDRRPANVKSSTTFFHLIKKALCDLSIWLALLCLVPFCARGQRYHFGHWDVSNGLPQSQVLALCGDRAGQVWLSTFAGVSGFDGQQFKNFDTNSGLASNTNFAIACDHKGLLWIGG